MGTFEQGFPGRFSGKPGTAVGSSQSCKNLNSNKLKLLSKAGLFYMLST
jgi:hypothetical protein